MDHHTSWARYDEDLVVRTKPSNTPEAMRERSKEISISLISRLACSSTSIRQRPSKPPTLLVEGDDGSRDGLADSCASSLPSFPTIDLSNATTTLHSDADVEVGESLSTEKEHGLDGLHSHALGLHHIDGLAVEFHDSVTVLAVSNGNSGLLQRV